nr:substrate-binding domain-containing protein [Rhodococcus sp. HNM0569]
MDPFAPSCDTVEEYTLAADGAIVPALGRVLSDADPHALGCASFEISAAGAGDVAGRLGKGADAPDLWIPDSSSWVSRAALTAAGAVDVLSGAVATSPVVLAAAPGSLPVPQSWTDALRLDGLRLGNPLDTGLAQGPMKSALAEGPQDEAAFAEVRGALVPLAQAESARADAEPTGSALLDEVVRDGSVAVTTEQQVLDYGKRHGDALAPVVPATGTHLLDYPLVVTSPAPDRHYKAREAARALDAALRAGPAQAILRDEGFRPPSAASFASGRGVGSVTALRAADPDAEARALGSWALMALPIRTLVAIDTSGSMEYREGDRSRMELTVEAAIAGSRLFPDSAQCGLWAFSTGLGGGSQDYLPLVPIRRMNEIVDGKTQRETLVAQAPRTGELVGGGTGLYDTTLAAFRTVQSSYDPRAVNSVIVLTDGENEDVDSISERQLLDTLAREQDPARPVIIVTIGITDDADAATLAEISRVTGGSSYVAKEPADIANVFVNALAHRGAGAR